jgi:hypothetical protein
MLDGIKQYLYLVVDRETNLILTRCQNASTANAVSRGFLNSSIMVIYYPFSNIKSGINGYSENKNVTYKLVRKFNMPVGSGVESNIGEQVDHINSNRLFDIVEVSDVSDAWIENRYIANLRSRAFSFLEMTLERHLSRFKQFVSDEMLYSYLAKELAQCNPEQNSYTPAILNYSEIVELPPQAVYYDLSMKYDSFNLTVLRFSAIWEKYIPKVNTIATESEFDKILNQCNLEINGRLGK